MKFTLLMISILCFVITVSAKVTVTSVHYMSGKDTVTSLLYMPEGKGPFPAIVVIHEWDGLKGWIKETAESMSKKGYITLAIDLYRGRVASTDEEAHELMRGLPEDRAARDLQAATAYLRTLKEVNGAKVGSIGWCMGGGYSLAAALNDSKLSACVICYGRLVTDSSTIAKIPCPILGLFGEDDQGISPQSVREFESACKQEGKQIAVTIYKGAGHRFMNSEHASSYRQTSAEDAWNKVYAFFDRTLKK